MLALASDRDPQNGLDRVRERRRPRAGTHARAHVLEGNQMSIRRTAYGFGVAVTAASMLATAAAPMASATPDPGRR